MDLVRNLFLDGKAVGVGRATWPHPEGARDVILAQVLDRGGLLGLVEDHSVPGIEAVHEALERVERVVAEMSVLPDLAFDPVDALSRLEEMRGQVGEVLGGPDPKIETAVLQRLTRMVGRIAGIGNSRQGLGEADRVAARHAEELWCGLVNGLVARSKESSLEPAAA